MVTRVIVGNRGGKVLIHNGFKYQKNRQRTESIYWRCWRKECRANLRTNIFDLNDMNPNIQILQEIEHAHEEDDDMIGKNETLNQMKDAIREDPTVPIKKVYNKVARAMIRGGGDREHIPEFHRIRTSMTRTRLEHVPVVPRTVDDITIEGTWRETWSGDNFFLHQDNDWDILVFTTDEHLICLQRCQDIYMDGTFRTASSPYRQYFSIHGKYR